MVISPPTQLPKVFPKLSIFLGGTIDLGNSINWQANVISHLQDKAELILNPRRENWDASWGQDSAELKTQVLWELEGQEKCGSLVYYFAANSASPITLLELGLFKYKNPFVFCHPNFYRRGNVKVTCEQYFIPYFTNETEWIQAIANHLGELH